MATIGWIKVGAAIDTSQFAKGMQQMTALTNKFGQTMGHLKGLLAGIGITLGLAAFEHWVKSAMSAVTETRKLGERVGMTSTDFQRLGYAARLSGIDQEQLTHSLEKMNERLAEVAIEGTGPAAEALRRFGINARKLTEMGTPQAFMVLLDLIQKIPNPMERSAVAMDLFGKSGQPMINLAMKGSDAIKAMGDEAEALGVALSGIDNAKVTEANVAFSKIYASIEGIANQVAVVLAPYITAISDQFIQWMKSGVKAGSYISQSMDWVTTAVGYAADALQLFTTGFLVIRSIFSEWVSLILKGLDYLIRGFIEFANLIPGVHLELSSFLKDWADLMSQSADVDFGEALKKSAQPWAHEFVRELKDEIEIGAQKRAEFSAGKQAAFAAPGAVTPKVVDTKFAAAQEQGSAAAYSARVGAQARLMDAKQGLLVDNTAKTAANTERIAIAVEGSKMRQGGGADGIQYREQASGR